MRGVHLGEEMVKDSEPAERIECACVPERVLERDVTPRCGCTVRPLIESFVVVVVIV
jgi:hypothetical protein